MYAVTLCSKWLVGKVIPKILPTVVSIIYYNRSVLVLTLHHTTTIPIPTATRFVTLNCKMAWIQFSKGPPARIQSDFLIRPKFLKVEIDDPVIHPLTLL